MKNRIYSLLLLAAVAISAVSCDDGIGILDGEGYEDFTSVFYLNDTGEITTEFPNVKKDITYTTSIRKGGVNPNVAGVATISAFTAKEVLEYNLERGTNFKLLPAEYYSLPASFEFGSRDAVKELSVTLKKEIGTRLDTDANNYILPLKLTSETTAVNDDVNTLILRLDVVTPMVRLNKTGKQAKISFSNLTPDKNTATFTLPVGLNVDNEGWAFDAVFETDEDELEAAVADFNATSAGLVQYKLLPADNYTFSDKVSFTTADKSKDLIVNIHRQAILEKDQYLLPMILKGTEGMPFDTDPKVCYIHVEVTGEMPQVILTGDQLYSNSNWDAAELPKLATQTDSDWQSIWHMANPTTPPCDPTYGIYIDINDIEDITQALKMEIYKKTKDHNEAKEIRLYAGTSESDLTLVWSTVDAFPAPQTDMMCETGTVATGNISMIRIAMIYNIKGYDMRNLTFYSTNYLRNVSISGIKLYGY